jgi:hypothetical protein
MHAQELDYLHDDAATEANEPLAMVVIYEDFATRTKAFEIYERLVNFNDKDVRFDATWWKSDHLRHPDVFFEAVAAARRADLLIVSIHAEAELPIPVKEWISCWVNRRQKLDGALAVLVSQRPNGAPLYCRAESFLKAVANEAGMDFFSNTFVVSYGEQSHSIEEFLQTRELVTAPVLDEMLMTSAAVSHWGINE